MNDSSPTKPVPAVIDPADVDLPSTQPIDITYLLHAQPKE